MAAAAPPKEAEQEGEKKKKPILKILLFVVGGIALIGAGFGSAILFIKLTTPKDENPLAIVIEKKGEGAPAEAEHAADAHAEAEPKGPHKVTEAEKKAAEAAAAKKGGEGGHGGGGGEGHGGGEGEKKGEEAKGKAVPQEEKFVTSYYEFPSPFTTNLKNSRKFIQAGLGIGTQYDASVIENLKKHELAIRSEVLLILADQTEADLIGIENRKKVQDKIRDGINSILTERERFGGIENVFFTTLVMQ
jgi:flagellar FliL protein